MTKLSHTFSYRLLRRWDHFCRLIPPAVTLTPRWEVWSDASGKGYGGHLGPQAKPLDVWQDSHGYLASGKGSTEYVEALAVLLSLQRWKDRLKGQKVFFYVDNYQVYKVLAKRYTPIKQLSLGFPLPLRIASTIGQRQIQSQSQHQSQGHAQRLQRSMSDRKSPQQLQQSQSPSNTVNSSTAIAIAKEAKGYFTSNPRCPKTQATFDEIDNIIKTYQIELRARWVWGKDNFLADTLSRISKLPRPSSGAGSLSGVGGETSSSSSSNLRLYRSNRLTPHVLELLEASRREKVGNENGREMPLVVGGLGTGDANQWNGCSSTKES
ncbi:hypothetical protein IAT40_003933 [Kwoniella sp. CBS 6097]